MTLATAEQRGQQQAEYAHAHASMHRAASQAYVLRAPDGQWFNGFVRTDEPEGRAARFNPLRAVILIGAQATTHYDWLRERGLPVECVPVGSPPPVRMGDAAGEWDAQDEAVEDMEAGQVVADG